MANILYIEDEPKLAKSVKEWLEEHGFLVDWAPDGAVGRFMISNKLYDAVLLDVNLPFIGGYEICRAIKSEFGNIPVIMVTADSTIEQKLAGFEAGADDYLVKPFDFRELHARMKIFLKRKIDTGKAGHAGNTLRAGDLEINTDYKTVRRKDQIISLTAKEYALLEYLIRNKGKVVSRHDISENVWNVTFDTGTNVVEVYINFLRKKIDKNFPTKLIHTKTGMGYYISDGDDV